MARYTNLDEVPPHILAKLDRHFTSVGGDTFVIHGLPPEVTGGALARYSRAPTGIQLTFINEFLDENGDPSQKKGSELMDRVLNQFGDDSVGQLEGTHVGIENISQLATKYIQSLRIGGAPIEQSTRYVVYDKKDDTNRWRYARPQEVIDHGLLIQYEKANDRAFEVYSDAVKRLTTYFESQLPQDQFSIDVTRDGGRIKASHSELVDDNERKAFRIAYNFTIRCAALDVGRCVLPSSTLTHFGVEGNGQFYTKVITTLKSNELSELRNRGYDLERELKKVIPTFIKRNKVNERKIAVDSAMYALTQELFTEITPRADPVSLVKRSSPLDETIAAALFPYATISLPQILDGVEKLSLERKSEICTLYRGNRADRRDRTGRGAEAGYPFTFDLVGTFAEYRDLMRHRMLTQQRQLLTTELGFVVPPEMIEVGLESNVNEVVTLMGELHETMKNADLATASQYATLFNHRIRFMMGMNLRELQHLCELRTQPAGHFGYRAMTQEIARAAIEREPWVETFLGFVDYSDPGNKISRAKEQSRIAGKNLATGITDGDMDF